MPVQIHGKDYKTVAERLNEVNNDTKGKYSLITDILEFSENKALIKATLTIDGRGTFVGHGYELQNSSMINKNAFVENCETSAIGRALASAGYAGSEFCSADELTNKLSNKSVKSPIKKEVSNIKSVGGVLQEIKNEKPIKFDFTESNELKCSDCNAKIELIVNNYSKKLYGFPLCRSCQKDRKSK